MLKKIRYEIFVIIFFVLIHLPNLGRDSFNTDVWKWKARIYDFGSGIFTLDFAKTIQKYHPGVTLMWAGTAAVKVYNLYYDIVFKAPPLDNSIQTVFELNFVQKLFVVLTIAFTLAFVFYPLRKKFGLLYASLFILFLTLEPFYLGLTREIHLEGLMSTFMIASFVWLVWWLDKKENKWRLYLSAIFTALAILTKTSALFLFPFSGILIFLDYYFQNKKFVSSLKSSLSVYWKWLLIALGGFVLFWPAMWVAPSQALDAIYRGIFTIGVERGHEQFYFNKFVLDPGPTFYFVVLLIKSSIYLLPGLLGLIYIRKSLDSNSKRFVIYSLIFTALYLLFITFPSKKLDRYCLPALVSLNLIAVYFYTYIFRKIKRINVLLFGILLLPGFFIVARIHPDYYSYFNPFFGGLRTGIFIIEPKWLIGEPQISSYFELLKAEKGLSDFGDTNIDELLDKPELDTKLTIAFQEKYYTQIWPFIRNIGGWAVIEDLTPYAVRAKYFVYPVWDDVSDQETRFNLSYVGSIKVRGVDLYNVYEKSSN